MLTLSLAPFKEINHDDDGFRNEDMIRYPGFLLGSTSCRAKIVWPQNTEICLLVSNLSLSLSLQVVQS